MKTKAAIIIFPAGVNLKKVNNFDTSIYGEVFSTETQIKVNSAVNGYTILYTDDVFEDFFSSEIGTNIVNIFTKNIPNTMIELSIHYIHLNQISDECVESVIALNEFFEELDHPNIEYLVSDSIKELEEYESDLDDDDDDSDDDEDDDDDDIYDDDDGDENDIFAVARKGNNRRKKEHHYYGESRVLRELRSAGTAKKSIKRHGIFISSEKDCIKKDMKTLKRFLKEFLPGDEEWIKRYRLEILERWIDLFVISKKHAKRIAKAHKEQSKGKSRKKSFVTKDKAMSLTRRILLGDDPFYDPRR